MEDDAQLQQNQANNQIQVQINQKDNQSFITLTPPNSLNRAPCDICCVVDISGSMGCEATLKNEKGDTESHGLSQLDLVKHSLKTIINILEPMDRLSIVSYSTDARIEFPLTQLTAHTKQQMLKKVEDLHPENSTNLWDGLKMGLDVLVQNSSPSQVQAVLLLTDGCPNVIPKQGHIKALQEYIDKQGFLHPIINTYGYGYSLDSKLLNELAIEGKGQYSFIPDGSIVGTVFVHALSNILSTMAFNSVISIEAPEGMNLVGNNGIRTSWGWQLGIGNINFGQSRTFLLEQGGESNQVKGKVSVKLSYIQPGVGNVDVEQDAIINEIGQEHKSQEMRLKMIEMIEKIVPGYLPNKEATRALIQSFLQYWNSFNVQDPYFQDVLKDVQGQVAEAVSKDEYFNKWGRHYLPSLSRTHQLQQCNNFKDPGIQHYGGQLFTTIRDKSDDIFVSLPPPKPSIKKQNVQQVQSMKTYYNACSGCVHANCTTTLQDGRKVQLKDIKKGDLVLSSDNTFTKVVCMIKSMCPVNSLFVIKDLIITPYHPILYKNSWEFPITIQEKSQFIPQEGQQYQEVYSFVLENRKSMKIGEYECASLGHTLKGKNVEHDYFGSEKIIEDLKKFSTWNNGKVELEENKKQIWVRDFVTNNICGMIH